MAFKIAGRWVSRRASARQAVLLEPIMKVEVVTPEDYYGDIVGDLNRRRGQIVGRRILRPARLVTADVPLAEMFSTRRRCVHEPGPSELHHGIREIHGSPGNVATPS